MNQTNTVMLAILIALAAATINAQPMFSASAQGPPSTRPGPGPTCPTGFTFNKASGFCEASACPTDTQFGTTTGQCVTSTPACPTGSTLTESKQCQAPATATQCPTGFTPTAQNTCTQNVCPEGFIFDFQSSDPNGQPIAVCASLSSALEILSKCPSGSTLSGSQCVSSTPACPSGTPITKTETGFVCKPQSTANQCPSGTTPTGTGTRGTCTISPSCSTGTLSGGVCQTHPIPPVPTPSH